MKNSKRGSRDSMKLGTVIDRMDSCLRGNDSAGVVEKNMFSHNDSRLNRLIMTIVIAIFSSYENSLCQLNDDSLFADNIIRNICERFTEASSVPIDYADYFMHTIQYCQESKKQIMLLTQYSMIVKSQSLLSTKNDTVTRRLYAIKYTKNNIERWSLVILSDFTSIPTYFIIDYSNSFSGDSLPVLSFKIFKPGMEYRNKQPFAYFKQKPSLNDLKKFLNYDPLTWRIYTDSTKGEKIIDGATIEENWRKVFNTKPLLLLPQQ
ncbi:MAG: hypothetical protein IT211_01725 [Armatimonadetes bacterium]|nr:hypothetical protein [Armatimonadota bacterium]